MKSFKEFGIKPELLSMTGEKIKIAKILNREITVHDYRIEESKFKKENNSRCLYLQISIDGMKHIVFTGSFVLTSMISKVNKEDFPFSTMITKEGEHYEFN